MTKLNEATPQQQPILSKNLKHVTLNWSIPGADWNDYHFNQLSANVADGDMAEANRQAVKIARRIFDSPRHYIDCVVEGLWSWKRWYELHVEVSVYRAELRRGIKFTIVLPSRCCGNCPPCTLTGGARRDWFFSRGGGRLNRDCDAC